MPRSSRSSTACAPARRAEPAAAAAPRMPRGEGQRDARGSMAEPSSYGAARHLGAQHAALQQRRACLKRHVVPTLWQPRPALRGSTSSTAQQRAPAASPSADTCLPRAGPFAGARSCSPELAGEPLPARRQRRRPRGRSVRGRARAPRPRFHVGVLMARRGGVGTRCRLGATAGECNRGDETSGAHSARPMNRGIGAWTELRHVSMAGFGMMAACMRAASGFVAVAAGLSACSRTSSETAPVTQNSTQTASPPSRQGDTAAVIPSAGRAPFLEPVRTPMTEEMATADRWLAALRSHDKTALMQSTQYPFEWLDSRGQACGAKQPATSAEELAPVLDGLLADAALLRALEQHDRAGIQGPPSSHLQDWAQPWHSHAPSDATLVNAFIKRSEGQADIDVWLVAGAVRALWTHVEDGTSAVNVAERWLDAFKRHDMEALSRRTISLDAFCGTARSPGEPRASLPTPWHVLPPLRRFLGWKARASDRNDDRRAAWRSGPSKSP
jgi:hypothetical protein